MGDYCECLLDFVRARDAITSVSSSLLHFENDKATKTLIGGVCTMVITMYIWYSGTNGLIRMFNLSDPYIISLEKGLTLDKTEKIPFINEYLSKPLFGMWEGGSDNPFGAVELDRESKKYINVRSRHIVKEYEYNGDVHVIDKYEPLELCSELDFETEFG